MWSCENTSVVIPISEPRIRYGKDDHAVFWDKTLECVRNHGLQVVD